ncbi:MAG TPA: DUF1549 domain-containing protein [Bryobacterales bacterium]|nr:DUF1549 domain-containing protein [Bryobacterales bacterium]
MSIRAMKRGGFWIALLSISVPLGIFRLRVLRAQDESEPQLPVAHPECVYFGPQHERYARQGLSMPGTSSSQLSLSALTQQVVRQLPPLSSATRSGALQPLAQMGPIDRNLFAAMQAAGVSPAPATTDFEFIRRVTLDLTGRIPAPDRVIRFVNDPSPTKREALVEELLAKPEWVDKWTMYFGDLFQNNSRNSQVARFAQGRNAFYNYIHDSLAANKPYDQMARELISAQGTDSFQQGELNWMVGGVVTGGPVQDIMDQQAANIADTFLGIAHMNCLLCHNGRGHLDQLSLWGSQGTRYQAWQFASFVSRTVVARVPMSGQTNLYSWSVVDNPARANYPLNTTTGNRPARQPSGTPSGTEKNVAPVYWFTGAKPAPGQNYRAALAQFITSDFQFARAAVNYIWAQFFGRGIVDPPDQFDLARLDPNNPPPAPWTLQPSNPALLQELAQDFVNSKFDLKALMREIVNSRAYQLSARYDGPWDPAWEPLFARKLVRRLWAEEIHDAVAQSSNVIPSYTITQNGATFGPVNWAMQFPETAGMPAGNAAVVQFLDAFLRGNRDDQQRRGDGSISQALDLMNDNFIMSRIRATGSGASASLLARSLSLPDDQLVNNLFLAVLSRYPTPAEMSTALANLQSGDRTQEAQNLLWSLYNKVDFVFNY